MQIRCFLLSKNHSKKFRTNLDSILKKTKFKNKQYFDLWTTKLMKMLQKVEELKVGGIKGLKLIKLILISRRASWRGG